ncbi:MAG: hypothetical protein IH600_15300 [Bacteroidetes bacterium]|nr:hypothetical protein [Bacteroidota bacterium]
MPATRAIAIFAILLLGLSAGPSLRAQNPAQALGTGKTAVRWPDRRRFLDGRLSVSLTAGLTKYFGEFSGSEVGQTAGLQLYYPLYPFLEFGAGIDAGRLLYTRRNRRNLGITYPYQFGEYNLALRSTEVMAAEAWLRLNLFPARPFNIWVLVGGGNAWLRPEDYRNGDAAYPGSETISALSIPLGAGFEWHLTRAWSLQLGALGHLVMSGEMDAFDSGELVQRLQESQGLPSNPDREKTANDTWLSVTFGLAWHLFDDTDFDDDGLSNLEEEKAGTNPNDPDTDGDGLTDFQELRTYKTDPLYWDTDHDVLSDYVEVTRYKTDPTNKDTDGDGLDDSIELLDYQTDPLSRDTEGDGLIDSEEKRLGCHPKKVDTDGDGLYDGDEVIVYHTNPVLPDSDGEGINDGEEVRIYHTDPNQADTDHDGLTDFEEIRLFRTDPLKADTDGDGRSDYEELRRFGTDPLKAPGHSAVLPAEPRGG